MIELTPTLVLTICAAIVTVSGAITALAGWIAKAKAPNQKQNQRIETLEGRMGRVEERLESGDRRFSKQDDDIRVLMESMLALMKHAINGNDIAMLKDAQSKLEMHLINHPE